MDKVSSKGVTSLLCLLAALLSLAFVGAGCQSGNDDKDLGILLTHISASGVKIDSFSGLDPEPAHAEIAVIAKIAGRDVGFYKYNLKRKKDREHLEKIKEKGWVGIAGKKFSVAINGSFIMIDYESNPEKDKLLSAFNSF